MAKRTPSPPRIDDGSPQLEEALKRIETARQTNQLALNLSDLQLTALPESLWSLTALDSLYLSDNQLAALPESLGTLTTLQILDLSDNLLAALPESLGTLTALEFLDLSDNQLAALPESLGTLTALEGLFLGGNQLAALPESLGTLTALKRLDLSRNKLAALPESLGTLTALKSLYLSFNQLAALPESLETLTALTSLDLTGNRLTALPESLGRLTALQDLYLGNNQLAALPESLGRLTALQDLYLGNNQLAALPESLESLTALSELYLHGNPGLGLSAEILGPTSVDGIRRKAKEANPSAILSFYFAQQKRTAKPLNEVKLLLVGHGRVGKTSLSKALRGVAHDAQEPETPGIERYQLALASGKSAITAHIWDFGGQEFLHQTHQFFFSERSLYLVVLAGGDRAPMQEAEYWLRLIRTYGTGSPVVIVLNKINDHRFTVDEFNLKDRYPEVKAVVEVDCDPRHGISNLQRLLGKLAARMPGVREKIDPKWAKVRAELERMEASYVSYEKYQEVCGRMGVTTAGQQDTLATILNCLGIALNYRSDPRLRDKSVLKPRWLVDGIYTVLRWLQKHRTNGVLEPSNFGKALKDRRNYPAETHAFLLGLMEKFELCFPLEGAAGATAYLVPALLEENQPREMSRFMKPGARRIQFRYDDLRPPGLLSRFIVRSHTLSEGQARWRRGVVLARGLARALVRADHAGRVTDVFALGENTEDRVWLTELILAEMKALNDRLPVKTLVESEAEPGAWTELEILRAAALKNETTRAEQTSDRGTVQVNVTQTLREVESAEASHPGDNPLQLFVCYAHANERVVKQFNPHLVVLAKRGYIAPWRDTDLVAGEDWDETIKGRLASAQVILFMVSREFLASPYITTEERPLARKLMAENKAVVVPVLLSHCTWQEEDFSKLEDLPRKRQYISEFPRAKAWTLVEQGLMKVVKEFRVRVPFRGRGSPRPEGI